MRRLASARLLVVLVLLFGSACGARSSQTAASTSSSSAAPVSASVAPSSGAAPTWLIVLRVAPDPAGVRDDAHALADVLGDAIQVAPGSCYTGIPTRFGGDRYILGAVGTSKAQVDSLAADAHIEPLFEGEVQVVCVD